MMLEHRSSTSVSPTTGSSATSPFGAPSHRRPIDTRIQQRDHDHPHHVHARQRHAVALRVEAADGQEARGRRSPARRPAQCEHVDQIEMRHVKRERHGAEHHETRLISRSSVRQTRKGWPRAPASSADRRGSADTSCVSRKLISVVAVCRRRLRLPVVADRRTLRAHAGRRTPASAQARRATASLATLRRPRNTPEMPKPHSITPIHGSTGYENTM